MKNILIFSGTTEGRMLAEYLRNEPVNLYISVATEYGKVCADMPGDIRILSGRMDVDAMCTCIRENGITLVVDATHPFAQAVTENIRRACRETETDYVRCLRGKNTVSGKAEKVREVSSVREAAEYLNTTQGNILIATGSKELREYTAIEHYQERCYARVLSTLEAVEESVRLGFQGKHLIAMQGPFSEELNTALLKQTDAEWFVTKESGDTGGYEEKIRAAKKAGVTLVVVRRPREEGMELEEIKTYLTKQIRIQ